MAGPGQGVERCTRRVDRPYGGCVSSSDAERAAGVVRLAVVVGALGVVFGEIGTSPIYTMQTVFNPDDPHPVPPTSGNVYGVVSLVFWSVMLIVTVTYVLLAMRVDNDGEGGRIGQQRTQHQLGRDGQPRTVLHR